MQAIYKNMSRNNETTTNKLTMKGSYIVVKQGLKQRKKELIKKHTHTMYHAKEKKWKKWRKLSKPPINQMKEEKKKQQNKIQRNITKTHQKEWM